MSAPALSATGQRLYDELEPLARDSDAGLSYPLARFCDALALLLDEVADLSRDGDDEAPGWTSIFDPDGAPAAWLPWMAQLVGVQFSPSLPEADRRARIKATDGFKRGTPAALVAAAQATLTGTKKVYLTERHGSAYRLTVATLASETLDPSATLAALMEQKPAGLVLTHAVVTGGTYGDLASTHTDYADVKATFASFDEVRTNPLKQ